MTDISLRSQLVILFTHEHLIEFNLMASSEFVDVSFYHLRRWHRPSSVTLGAMSRSQYNQRRKLI
jgi:capsule polysaccharide export protein KpsE/RkpR